ncbi:MAG: hypothetical protein QNI96_13430 [Woeseiaceae bacterium]|nr:hypothetical protein [Woeseiaceae bacterium]
MTKWFSLQYSLDTVAAIVAAAGLAGVLQTFIIGKHFVIPTMLLAVTILFANLARFGYRDNAFAKNLLFWFGVLVTCHAFFALFWAKTPREILGGAFLPVYGGVFVIFALLSWQYARRNRLFQ